MTADIEGPPERHLLSELKHQARADRPRSRALCRALFGDEELADFPPLACLAAYMRIDRMEGYAEGDDETPWLFRIELEGRAMKAIIPGGPPRRLRVAASTL